MWGLPPPFFGTGLADGRRKQCASNTIDGFLVKLQGRVRVSQEKLDCWYIRAIKGNCYRIHGQSLTVCRLLFGWGLGITGAGATAGALSREEVLSLIVVDVFHMAAFLVTVTEYSTHFW